MCELNFELVHVDSGFHSHVTSAEPMA